MVWYIRVLKKYADFEGRARRKEYWMFTLFNIFFVSLALIIDNILGTTIDGLTYGFFYFFYLLAVFIPGLAVAVRRLHDVGKTGWLLLVSLIPIIGGIWLFILMVSDSDPDENNYGPNPKLHQTDEFILSDASRDTILALIVCWLVLVRLFWIFIPMLFKEYYLENWFDSVNALTVLISAFIPIGISFVIKNKSKRILFIILSVLYFLNGIYEIYMRLK